MSSVHKSLAENWSVTYTSRQVGSGMLILGQCGTLLKLKFLVSEGDRKQPVVSDPQVLTDWKIQLGRL